MRADHSHHRVGLAKGVGSIHARKVRLPQFSRAGLWCPQFGSQAASFDASAGSAGSGGTTIAPILAFGVSCKTNACSDAVPAAVSFCASATAADRPRIDDALMTARQQSANHAGPHPTQSDNAALHFASPLADSRRCCIHHHTGSPGSEITEQLPSTHCARFAASVCAVAPPSDDGCVRCRTDAVDSRAYRGWSGIGQIRRHPG